MAITMITDIYLSDHRHLHPIKDSKWAISTQILCSAKECSKSSVHILLAQSHNDQCSRFSLPDAILSFIVTVRLPKLSILTYISLLPLIGIRWWLVITNWWANFWLLFNQLVITRNICLLFETLFIVLLWYSMDAGWTNLICYQRSLTHHWSWLTA